jgi:hypothetical protein
MNVHVLGTRAELLATRSVIEDINMRIDVAIADFPTHASVKVKGLDHRSYLVRTEVHLGVYLKAITEHLDAMATESYRLETERLAQEYFGCEYSECSDDQRERIEHAIENIETCEAPQ